MINMRKSLKKIRLFFFQFLVLTKDERKKLKEIDEYWKRINNL